MIDFQLQVDHRDECESVNSRDPAMDRRNVQGIPCPDDGIGSGFTSNLKKGGEIDRGTSDTVKYLYSTGCEGIIRVVVQLLVLLSYSKKNIVVIPNGYRLAFVGFVCVCVRVGFSSTSVCPRSPKSFRVSSIVSCKTRESV